MKKKILISLIACFIAAGSVIHFNLAQNASMLDVSLADISVMAQADGESGGHTCSATANCFLGGLITGSVSCTGVIECTSGYMWVECDGHRSSCG